MPTLKLIIFDCDGVMFDSREANRHYYNHLLTTFDCPPMSEEEVDYVHVHNVNDSVRHIFRHHPQISREAVDRYRQRLDYSRFLKYMHMEEDLLPFLERIRPIYATAISTNRTTTMPLIMEMFGLKPWFDLVVTAQDTPRPKPAPDGLRMILDHFRVTADQALYIGDSEVDRLHCQPLGVPLVAFKNPQLSADYHVESFSEILALPPLHIEKDTHS